MSEPATAPQQSDWPETTSETIRWKSVILGWRELAEARQKRGDVAGAETLLWQLVTAGDNHALVWIADLRLKAGDPSGAKDILRRP